MNINNTDTMNFKDRKQHYQPFLLNAPTKLKISLLIFLSESSRMAKLTLKCTMFDSVDNFMNN